MKEGTKNPPKGPGNKGAVMIAPKEPINKDTVKRLLTYIFKDYKLYFVIVIICLIVSSLAGVAGQLFIKVLIDDYIAPLLLESMPVFTELLKALMIMSVIYLIGIACNYINQRIMIKISQNVLKKIRDDMFKHMQTLPVKYFDEHSHGDIMSRYTNDTDTLRQMISQSVPQCITSLITIISMLCAMLYLSIPLTIVVIIGVFLMLKTSKSIAVKASKYFVKQQESIGKVNGFIEEMIDGQKVIKVFTHEKESKMDFDKLNNELTQNMTNANKYANTMMPIMHNIGNIIYVMVAIVGSVISISTSMLSLGSIASFLTITKSFFMPINQVSQQFNSIVMALAGATRIFTLLDEKSEENDGKITLVNAKEVAGELVESNSYTGTWAWKYPDNNKLVELKGDVRFFDVDFGYEKDKQILFDINLYAKPGHKIAFVGSTGAGKTTITNLINRFYDVDSGKITYDGIDIKEINKNDLRLSLGIVLQDTNLFTGTIMDNIRYGKKNATDEECIEASRLANADSFIRMLPNGYDTVISGNGSNLSQGQRQLLAIARSAVANPPVMILDEATSSIDTRTEKIVQDGMDKLMNNRTVFVIAHRLSTVHNSKAIIVLEHGVIIERGNHDQLIDQKGKYYQLYTGAFELE